MQVLLITPYAEEKEFLAFALRHAGFQVAVYTGPMPSTDFVRSRPFELVVLATTDADTGGESIGRVRAETDAPLLTITDPITENEHCRLLDDGADIVFARPVSTRLLVRYGRMLLRRYGGVFASTVTNMVAGGIHLDPNTRTVTLNGDSSQQLTQLEYRLLYVLMANQGQVIPVDEIVEQVWGYDDGEANRDLVRGLVRRLRRKIEPDRADPYFIQNLPGVGYRFTTGGDDSGG